MNITLKTIDGFLLDAEFKKAESDRGIIFVHGIIANKEEEGIFARAAKELFKLGFTTLEFDFRAHGHSQGNSIIDVTISNELKDLGTAVKFMQVKGINWLGLAGASFGGGISSLYAGENPDLIQKLFMANPVLDYETCFLKPTTPWAKQHFTNALERTKKEGFISIGKRQMKVGRQLFEEMSRYFPYKSLDNFKGPLMIVQGNKDTKVSIEDVKKYFEKLKNPNKQLVVINGSEHGFHQESFETEVTKLIVNFFKMSNYL